MPGGYSAKDGLRLATRPTPETDEEADVQAMEDEFYGRGREGAPFEPGEFDSEQFRRNQRRLRAAWEQGRRERAGRDAQRRADQERALRDRGTNSSRRTDWTMD